LFAAQSPQGLKGVVVLTHNIFEKEKMFFSQKLSNRKA
jgi:hypothetical protein